MVACERWDEWSLELLEKICSTGGGGTTGVIGLPLGPAAAEDAASA